MLIGYLAPFFFPDTFSTTYNSPLLMYLFCIVFALGVSYIAYRGVNGSTAVNLAINVIQITALVFFAILAIAYRTNHKQGDVGFHLSNGVAVNYQVAQTPQLDANNKPIPVLDAKGNPTKNPDGTPAYQMQDAQDANGNPGARRTPTASATTVDKAAPFTIDYRDGAWTTDSNNNPQFNYHPTAKSVIGAAQVQLHLHPGLHRDPLPGRLRIGDLDGRGGEESEEAPALGHPAVPHDPGRDLLPVRVLRGQLPAQQRLHDDHRRGLLGPDRRPDAHHRHLALRQRGRGQGLHARAGADRVPGADRHDPRLPEHGRPRHLRDGPRPGGRRALRPAPRQEPHAAQGDLDALHPVDHHRDDHGDHLPRRHDAGGAGQAQHLVQLRDLQPGVLHHGAQFAALRHPDQQLRDVPALHDDLHRRDRGLPRAPHVPRHQARRHPGLRAAGQPGLHAVLPDRSVLGRRA